MISARLSWFGAHRDIAAFQAANFVFSLWLVWGIHAYPFFPWQDLLAMEALIWISTAPFYSQSAAIGALPPDQSSRYSTRITAIKLVVGATAFASWAAVRDPSAELATAATLCFLGAALLPQWLLFSDRFQEYAVSLALCRLTFIGAMLGGVDSVAVLLVLYGLQHPVSATVVWRLNRSRRAGLTAASVPAYDLAASSLAFTARYMAGALAASSVFLSASTSLLPLLALLDRVIRPLTAALAPYLLRAAQLRAAPAIATTAARAMLWLVLPLALAAALSRHVLLAYIGLLLAEAAGVFHFVGTRSYRSRAWLGLCGISFVLAIGAALVAGPLASAVAVGLLAAGQIFLLLAEGKPPPEAPQ